MPRRPKANPEAALMAQLDKLAIEVPGQLITRLAKETKWSERIRKISPPLFFWNLILGFGAGMQKSLAALKQRYMTVSDEQLAPSSFFDRFNDRLVTFLEGVLKHLLATAARSEMPRKILECFKDVLVLDNTIVRLLDSLASVFPGVGMPAGVKISSVLSLSTASPTRFDIAAGKKADVKTFDLGPWVKDCLLLFDLGFFKFAMLDRIKKLGGHFITRLHGNANPKVVSSNINHRGRAIKLEGRPLRQCLGALNRQVLDVMAETTFFRRAYRGKRTSDTVALRVVGVMDDETGDYHLYATDLSAEAFPAEQVAELYRGRWCVELMFKELKSRYALDVINTGNPAIAKALIYSALITLVISRRLFVGYRDALLPAGLVATPARWAKFLVEHSGRLLREYLRRTKIDFTEEQLWSLALHDTFDPNPLRDRLEDVWNL